MKGWRKKIFDIIEPRGTESRLSRAYDIFMIVVILLCIVPLLFKEPNKIFAAIDTFAAVVFIIDYILRLITADYHFKTRSILAFLQYPLTLFALVDLLSILPFITPLDSSFRAFRLVRLFLALRVITLLRYSKSLHILKRVFIKQKDALLMVFGFALGYIMLMAIIMFQIEPDLFGNFWDALYWATVSLTTIGYGDITAVTLPGRLFTILSAFVGIAIIALPAGVVTAGYMEELNEIAMKRREKEEAEAAGEAAEEKAEEETE